MIRCTPCCWVVWGSTFVRELINSHELQLAKWLDYVTTVIKYKEIDPSVSVPIPDFDIDANVEDQVSNTNQELERGATEGFRDWNRRIVPAMMGKKLKPFGCTDGKNIPWQSFDDLLYRHKLTVTSWPAGVAAPPTWVPHDATVDELISVVGPFLKRHLPSLYSRHIVPNAGRRRSSKGKNKQPHLPIPEVEISVVAWIPEWCHWLEHNDSRMFTIPLVMDTESQPLCILRQCRKFLRDVPRDISIPPEPESERCSSPLSPSSHGPSPVMPPKRAKGIVKQHHRTHLGPLPVPFSKANLPPRKRHHNEEESLEEHLGHKHMKPESRVRAARTQQAHRQLQPDTSGAEMLHCEVLHQQRAERPIGVHHAATRPSDLRQTWVPPSFRGPIGHQSDVPMVCRHHEPTRRQPLARPPPLQTMYRSRSPTHHRRTHVLRNPSPVAGPSRVQYLEVNSGDEDFTEDAGHDYYDSYYD
ncbi:hypothetical protein PAXINDRAFT_22341 [Paxillus involutus ATCC 200175]|uniref:Uncharacterized protein n=1 Tax=Paxillus involutus ATCC 200175 TaxID=664439 RepID=A0A0C9SLG3_PAXIN|nr:hypothetical protein PAXINDRAFT_22341 [Paxillus involutus ATCC 200175]